VSEQTTLSLLPVDGGDPIEFRPRALVVAGFTGRDRAAVEHHLAELAELGVAEPAQIPSFYRLPADLVTAADSIAVGGEQTSGEVEPVLFRHEGRFYVGLGSDHTARDLEGVDIALSKAACPKVVGTEVIAYDDAVPIPELLALMEARGEVVEDGTVVFLGTLSLLASSFVYSDRWAFEMALPDGTTLTCSYDVGVENNQPEVMT
jgi:hypothetical protein